jgi:hypothetical protein
LIRWKKSSSHSIVSDCGRFHIARLMSGEIPGYLLWDGKELVSECSLDAEVKKREAQAIKNASGSDLKASRRARNKELIEALRSGVETA